MAIDIPQIPKQDTRLVDDNGRPDKTWYKFWKSCSDYTIVSPDGTKYKIVVSNAGILSTVAV